MTQPVTTLVRKKKNQPRLALAVAVLSACAAVLVRACNANAALPYLFGLAFGYIMQRSAFCFAAGFRDIFMIRNTALTRAVLLAIALTTMGFGILQLLGAVDLPTMGKVYPVGLHTLVGGILFGFGMVIAGSCVSGCLVRMGEGYIMQWVTFLGILTGSAAGAWNLGFWYRFTIAGSPTVFLPGSLGWTGAYLLQYLALAALYLLALRFGGGAFSLKPDLKSMSGGRKWTYPAGAAALAAANTALFWSWGRPWSITSGLTSFSGWLSSMAGLSPFSWEFFQRANLLEGFGQQVFLRHPLIYLSFAMITGSLYASLSRSEFRLRRPRNYKYVLSALAGGLLMGYSSRIAMGCNIGALLSGTASLSLHGWLFGLAILPGAYLGGKYLLRFIVE